MGRIRFRSGATVPAVPVRAAAAPRQVRSLVVLAAASAWLGLAGFTTAPPRFTRDQMEAALDESERWLLVVGTRDPEQAPALRERALLLARRFYGGDTSRVVRDRDVTEQALARGPVLLFGGPAQNEWTRTLAASLPVEFTAAGFRWAGHEYSRPGDALHLVYPNPLDPHRFLLLVAGNSPAALEREGGGFFFGAEDWRIYRDGELLRSGVFAQSAAHPWRYDPALDHDRESEARRYAAALHTVRGARAAVSAPPGSALASQVLAQAEGLLARLDTLGFAEHGAGAGTPGVRRGAAARPATPPIAITLYRSLEEKGLLARDTRAEQLENGAILAAPAAGRPALDLWSVAAARLVRLGAGPGSPFLHPAAVALCGRIEGEPLERAVARLYFGRALPSPEEAAAPGARWRSPLLIEPARALLARALLEVAGPRRRAALLALLSERPPGTLDSLCRACGVSAERLAGRYRVMADSLGRVGQAEPGRAPLVWRPVDGFQRGVCLAHAVSLEHGYLSEECARALATLQRMGANWVSLTPFGFLPPGEAPEIVPSAVGGPNEESDEALCEAGARARALGLRVWLKPHLWTRGWVGDLSFGPVGWERFFESYRVFILHYAVLAEREGFDGLVVGHELASASVGFPDRWRALIGEVRRLYHGTLSYDANWGDEVRGITFWDALDLVSVSFYEPLAAKPTVKVTELQSGAARALAGLKTLAARTHRPVLLSEVGYAATTDAPVRPWEEHRTNPDLEAQRACYEAFDRALAPCDWVAGAFFWKWWSGGKAGGALDASFTPQGKPAEQVMGRVLREWQHRPVRVLEGPSR